MNKDLFINNVVSEVVKVSSTNEFTIFWKARLYDIAIRHAVEQFVANYVPNDYPFTSEDVIEDLQAIQIERFFNKNNGDINLVPEDIIFKAYEETKVYIDNLHF